MKYWLLPLTFLGLVTLAVGLDAGDPAPADPKQAIVLQPGRVYDGVGPSAHEGWIVVVRGSKIEAVGSKDKVAVPD